MSLLTRERKNTKYQHDRVGSEEAVSQVGLMKSKLSDSSLQAEEELHLTSKERPIRPLRRVEIWSPCHADTLNYGF